MRKQFYIHSIVYFQNITLFLYTHYYNTFECTAYCNGEHNIGNILIAIHTAVNPLVLKMCMRGETSCHGINY